MRLHAAGLALLLFVGVAQAQDADLVLLNGKILTLAARDDIQEALAIRDSKVLAVGRTDAMRKRAGPNASIIDLGGRTVIPGLIDSHMHAVRAGLFFGCEVNWTGVRSIPEAMARIAARARAIPPGQWIVVGGGWTEQQFAEKRRPTQAELVAAAGDHPAYIQLFYRAALLSPAGFEALRITNDHDVPPAGKLERDSNGTATGWILGDNPTITALFDRLPLPTYEEKIAGTIGFFRELNHLGLTGVLDPGGYNLPPNEYQALFKVWQDGKLTVRLRYSLFAQHPNSELEDFKSAVQMLPMRFGDDMLRFNGIGENVTWGSYNNDNMSDAQKEQLYQVTKWAAERGMTLTIHWQNDRSVGSLLEVFERVNRDLPLAPLRWSIAHLNDASPATIERMRSLGLGWTMQDFMYFVGDSVLRERGSEVAGRMPPIGSAIRAGLPIGGGTDAHRVSSYNPFVVLQWMIGGKTVSRTATRTAAELPSREDALRIYTQGSAWFTFEDDKRGVLAPGRLADLAVLSGDFLTVPTQDIGNIESLLTIVGGKVVYAAGPYRGLETQ
jgi:predicted amidohydrolase YtcJ